MDRYSWLIVHWCRHEGLSTDDAPDVLQAVLLQVLQNLGQFQRMAGRPPFAAGCGPLRGARWPSSADEPPGSRAGTAAPRLKARILTLAADGSKVSGVRGSVRCSSDFGRSSIGWKTHSEPTTWQAFWLTTFENLNSTQAAEVLKITPAAVRLAKARVVRRIRKEDADLADELNRIKEYGTSDQ